jgi:hypothetical protein
MALESDAERVLEMVRLSGRPPYETLTPLEARALFLAAREILAPEPAPLDETQELSGPVESGAEIPLRLYPDQTHGFLTMGKIVRAAEPALAEIAEIAAGLRAAFERV